MFDRLCELLCMVAGLVLVAGLMLGGASPEAWARDGSIWRRRLVAAALIALGLGGLPDETRAQPGPRAFTDDPRPSAQSGDAPRDREALDRRITFVRDVLDGRRVLPDSDARRELLDRLQNAAMSANVALNKGTVDRATFDRVLSAIDQLTVRVNGLPPGQFEIDPSLRIQKRLAQVRKVLGSRGPASEETCQALLDMLGAVSSDLDRLAQAGRLAKGERDRTLHEVGLLQGRVNRLRLSAARPAVQPTVSPSADPPGPPPGVTCYDVVPPGPVRALSEGDSLRLTVDSLEKRLPLLEKYAQERFLGPGTIRSVIASIERDLSRVNRTGLEQLSVEERARAERVRQSVTEGIARLRKLIGAAHRPDEPGSEDPDHLH